MSSPMPETFVEGAWVNVAHDSDPTGLDPGRIMWRGDGEIEIRFPGEDFNRLYVHREDDRFVSAVDGPNGREYRSEATLVLERPPGGEHEEKSREEMIEALAWADLDLAVLADDQLTNLYRWCELQHELGVCLKPVWSVIKKERRRGATNRLGDRWVLYTYCGTADTEREQGVYFKRKEAKLKARMYEALRWAEECNPTYGRLVKRASARAATTTASDHPEEGS